MAFQVRLFRYAKHAESTARPDNADGTNYTGNWKEPSTIISPRIKFNLGAESAPNANYAFIPIFDRYYFITSWEWNAGFWTAYMECDVLASWKNTIGATTQYVLRAASKWNPDIQDGLYPATCKNSYFVSRAGNSFPLASTLENGCFVLGVISSSSKVIGAVSYYALDIAAMQAFCGYLMGGINWLNLDFSVVTDLTENLWKTLFNPYQYIVSCYWFPFGRGNVSGVKVDTLDFGWWHIDVSNVNVNALTSTLWSNSFTLYVARHPQATQRKNYLNFEPYTHATLFYPPFGAITLPMNDYYGGTTVLVYITIDVTTGTGVLKIMGSSPEVPESPNQPRPIIINETMIGVPIALTQMGINVSGNLVNGISQGMGAAGNVLGGNIAGTLLGAIPSGIQNQLNWITPETHNITNNGSFAKALGDNGLPIIITNFQEVVEDDPKHHGYPLHQNVKINTLSGYVLCSNSEVAINGTKEEVEKISQYMNGGFYYE